MRIERFKLLQEVRKSVKKGLTAGLSLENILPLVLLIDLNSEELQLIFNNGGYHGK